MTALPILTASLELRPFAPQDVAKALAMSQESKSRRWLPDQVYDDEKKAKHVVLELATFARIRNPQKAPLVLGGYLQSNNELIGHVGLSMCKAGVEVGYAIETAAQGQGYATEAVVALSSWYVQGREESVWGIVVKANAASCRVLEKSGFTFIDEEVGDFHGRREILRRYCREPNPFDG
ncbi:MAG: GNAT family N-acetyltransferase [Deltaproteobacteria bacterium]|nr:GNAT family N-acetyltransferase [Deltaproteobacteria bacterium]